MASPSASCVHQDVGACWNKACGDQLRAVPDAGLMGTPPSGQSCSACTQGASAQDAGPPRVVGWGETNFTLPRTAQTGGRNLQWKAAGPSLRRNRKPQNRPEIGVEEPQGGWIKEPRNGEDRETGCKWRREWATGVGDAQLGFLWVELPWPLRRNGDAVTGTWGVGLVFQDSSKH